MYVKPNYKTKKEFLAAVKAGVKHQPYSPNGFFPVTINGSGVIEGPHYPKPHHWYSAVVIKDGVVIKAT